MAEQQDLKLNIIIRGDTSSAKASLNEAKGSLNEADDAAKKAKVSLDELASAFAGVGIAAVGLGASLSGFVGLAAKTAGDLQMALAGTEHVMRINSSGVQDLGKAMGDVRAMAIQLGLDTEYTAVQAAEAMTQLGRAGLDVVQVLSTAPATLQLASSTGLGLADTARILTAVLNPFHLAADQAGAAANTLAVASASGAGDLSSLAESMKFAAPAAQSLGWTINETAAAMAVFGKAGITGTMQGTALRAILERLIKPTAEAMDTFKAMGITLHKTADGMIDARDTLDQLSKSHMNLADATALFGRHASTEGLVLVQNIEQWKQLTARTYEQGNALKELQELRLATLPKAIDMMVSSFETLMKVLGDPIQEPLRQIVLKIVDLLNAATHFAEAHPKLVGAFMGIAGGAGVALIAFGSLGLAIAGIAKTISLSVAGWGTLTQAIRNGIAVGEGYVGAARQMVAANEQTVVSLVAVEAEFTRLIAKYEQFKQAQLWQGANATKIASFETFAASQAPAATGGGVGAGMRAALPGLGMAAGVGGAMFANMADIDKDLKGINTTLLDISAVAGILPGKFGAIGQAVTAWGSVVAFVSQNWEELGMWLKQDLGILYEIGEAIVNAVSVPMRAMNAVMETMFGLMGRGAAKTQEVTQAQKDLAKSAAEAGLSWAEFKKQWQDAFQTNPPDEIVHIFTNLRMAASRAGEESAKVGTETSRAMGKSKQETKEAAEAAKHLGEALHDAFATLKETVGGQFSAVNESIQTTRQTWKDSVTDWGVGSVQASETFKGFSTAVQNGFDALSKSVTEKFDLLRTGMRTLFSEGGTAENLATMNKGIEDFARAAVKEFEGMSKDIKAALRDIAAEQLRLTNDMRRIDEQLARDMSKNADETAKAQRAVRQSTMTDEQKYADDQVEMWRRVVEAQKLIGIGGEDNLKRAQSLMRQNMADAQTMVKLGQDGVSQAQAENAIDNASYLLDKATLQLAEEKKAQDQAQFDRLQKEKEDLQDKYAMLQKYIAKLKETVAVSVDTTAAEKRLEELFRNRVIDVTIKNKAGGEAGVAEGPAAVPVPNPPPAAPPAPAPTPAPSPNVSQTMMDNFMKAAAGNEAAVALVNKDDFSGIVGSIDDFTERVAQDTSSFSSVMDGFNRALQNILDGIGIIPNPGSADWEANQAARDQASAEDVQRAFVDGSSYFSDAVSAAADKFAQPIQIKVEVVEGRGSAMVDVFG